MERGGPVWEKFDQSLRSEYEPPSFPGSETCTSEGACQKNQPISFKATGNQSMCNLQLTVHIHSVE